VATTTYATRAELKSRMSITVTTWDTMIDDVMESVSREIDGHCNRRFWVDDDVSARIYYPDSYRSAEVDEFSTTIGLVIKVDSTGEGTYATTWTSSDYELSPLNGVVDGEAGWPYRKIKPVGGQRFPTYDTEFRRAPLQVTAKWGWAAVPGPVKQACLILGEATFKSKDAAFGVAGFDGVGVVRVRDNPMAAAKLSKYRRILVG
jgi:hypothetical protein